MFCHKCGVQIAERAAFCHKCGAKVVHGDAASPISNTEPESKTSADILAKKMSRFIGPVLFVIIILVLVMSGTLQNALDYLIDINREIENRATGSTTISGTQSAAGLFPATSDSDGTANNSSESSFAWVEDAHIITEGDLVKIRYIVGAIQNISDITFASASVKFILYDSAGNQIDTTRDVISNFISGNTWRFKAIILSDDAVDFEFLHATKTYP